MMEGSVVILRGYEKTIEIISDIMKRYDEMMPGVFRKLNIYEKKLIEERPRHIFSKGDCRYVMKEYKMPVLDENRLDLISECLLLLYNWYKSKVIYSIEQEKTDANIRIDREKIKLFPYSGIYLDLEFYSLQYMGCFISVIRERKEISLQKYILIGFVEYNKEFDMYGIEPFLLEVRDGVSIREAFLKWLQDSVSSCKNLERNIKASVWVMSNLYQLIEKLNANKELKQTASIHRNVISQTLISVGEDEYRLTKESKYRYISNETGVKGSKKSPHVRRTHNRHYTIKDETGNIIGEKVITIREMRIHAEEENITTVKVLPEEEV